MPGVRTSRPVHPCHRAGRVGAVLSLHIMNISASHWDTLAFIAFFVNYSHILTTHRVMARNTKICLNRCNDESQVSQPREAGCSHHGIGFGFPNVMTFVYPRSRVGQSTSSWSHYTASQPMILKGVIIYGLHPFIIIGF